MDAHITAAERQRLSRIDHALDDAIWSLGTPGFASAVERYHRSLEQEGPCLTTQAREAAAGYRAQAGRA